MFILITIIISSTAIVLALSYMITRKHYTITDTSSKNYDIYYSKVIDRYVITVIIFLVLLLGASFIVRIFFYNIVYVIHEEPYEYASYAVIRVHLDEYQKDEVIVFREEPELGFIIAKIVSSKPSENSYIVIRDDEHIKIDHEQIIGRIID